MEAKSIVKISNVESKLYLKIKTDPVYFRISAHVVTLVVHLVNTVVMIMGFRGEAMEDPIVQTYYIFQYRFISTWTLALQIIYTALGLYCDYISLKNRREFPDNSLKPWEGIRETALSSVVVPYSFMVPTMFWILYIYDRNLVLPLSMNKAVSSTSNHIIHTGVIPVTLWEIIFLPREVPKSHSRNLLWTALFSSIYMSVLAFTYHEKGMWPYPILNMLHGTIYFQIFIALVTAFLPFYYYLQWHLTRLIWRHNTRISVKID